MIILGKNDERELINEKNQSDVIYNLVKVIYCSIIEIPRTMIYYRESNMYTEGMTSI